MDILERLWKVNRHQEYVFSDPTKPNKHMSSTLLLKLMADIMEYDDKATPHSIRSTASTMLHENGFNSEHIEIQLSHISGS